jgi:predicted ATP-grasp superfamily ATP-dependent carboligase
VKLGEERNCLNWIIFPTNDFQVKLLSQNKQALQSYFIITTDKWDVVEKFYNKKSTYKLADNMGIPYPKSWYPLSENELNEIPVSFPCIVKPAVMHNFFQLTKKKVFLCRNRQELIDQYRKAISIIAKEEIIVQEIIPGESSTQYSSCFLFLNGGSYVNLTACRMRQHPLDFGNATTFAVTQDIPILKEYSEKLLYAVNYNGLCEVEFKFDERDQKYKFLEVNPRTWKWHSIANKAETPFLKLYFDYLCGNSIIPVNGYKAASFYHFLTDFPTIISMLIKGRRIKKWFSKPVEFAVWALDDFKPWLFEKLYLINLIKTRN